MAAVATVVSSIVSTTSAAIDKILGTGQSDKENDAARLAQQATFGPTKAVIDRIVELGVDGWLDEQFAATGSTYADIAAAPVVGGCTDDPCFRVYYGRWQTAMRFYADAVSQPDQLRQRVALALGQIIVASVGFEIRSTPAAATYHQVFLENAFGNYRTVLEKTMMTCTMGAWLNMDLAGAPAGNENYPRELMQLFTMGPNKLNMDGSPVLDSKGALIPNYTLSDIKGMAQALTGWGCAQTNGDNLFGDTVKYDYSKPMRSLAWAWRYNDWSKTFLGTTVGNDQKGNVQAVLDAVMNNPSTAPFVSKQLIQHLVTANPSPGYVARVAAVFANNGKRNIRGDLQAVVRAILTDPEARSSSRVGDGYGKVKEPVLLMTALARATNMTTDGWMFTTHDRDMGQELFSAPSVFNFYPPTYLLPKQTTLLSPTSKLITTGTIIQRHNVVYNWTIGAATTPAEFAPTKDINVPVTGSAQNWSSWEAFGTDLDGMIDRADLLLTARSLTATQKAALKSAATAVTNSNPTLQARLRAQTILYAIATSPLFQVDR